LASLGLYLLQTIWSGTLYWYINQRFMLLILSAGVGLLVLASNILPPRSQSQEMGGRNDWHVEPTNAQAHHNHGHRLPAWSMLVVALPLALGVLVPAQPLGTSAIANRGINTTAPLAAGSGGGPVRLDLAPTERSVLDWVRAFNYAESVHEFDGQPADVIGFVYHEPALAEGEFLVSRFAVTCCAADAVAIGVLVRWADAAGLQDNSWVRVTGAVSAGKHQGRDIPVIDAEFVEGIAPPAQPYLYP
jgi:putative membrane protein